MLLALLCTVLVLILNICMFCDRIRLKGKLAKRQSIKIDGILKFNIIALHCLPPISDLGLGSRRFPIVYVDLGLAEPEVF